MQNSRNAPNVNVNAIAKKQKIASALKKYMERITELPIPQDVFVCHGIMVHATFTKESGVSGHVEIILTPDNVQLNDQSDSKFAKISNIEIDEMFVDIGYTQPTGQAGSTGLFQFYNHTMNTGRGPEKKIIQTAMSHLWNLCMASIYCVVIDDANKYRTEVFPRLAGLLFTNAEFGKRSQEQCRRKIGASVNTMQVPMTSNSNATVCVARRAKSTKQPGKPQPVKEFELQGWGATHPDMSPYDMNDMLDRVIALRLDYDSGAYSIRKENGSYTQGFQEAINDLLMSFRKEQENSLKSFLASKGIRHNGTQYVYEPEAGVSETNSSVDDIMDILSTIKMGGKSKKVAPKSAPQSKAKKSVQAKSK